MTMADSIAVMSGGRIQRLGTPFEIYEDPQSAFVASFLGSSNLVDASVVDAARGELSVSGHRVWVVPERLDGAGAQVKIGVRPEKLVVIRPQDQGAANSLGGTIADVSFIGVSTQYLVDTELGTSMAAVQQNTGGRGFTPGEDVVLSWAPEHTFVVR